MEAYLLIVTCAGILVADIIAADLPKISDPGELTFAPKGIEVHLGGHCGNVSIDLRKLGLKAGDLSSIGAVGYDIFGDFIEGELKKHGVIAHLQRIHNVGTSKDLILVVRGEDRRYHVDSGANLFLSPDFVLSILNEEQPLIFYAGGVGLTGRFDERLPEVLRKSKDLGALTFVDPVTPYMRGWDFLIPAIRWTDIFHCNAYEAEQITGRKNLYEACESLIEIGANIVIISMGDKGLIARTKENIFELPAFKVPTVDPTGAGDALCAGVISGLVEKCGYRRCNVADLSANDIIDILMIGEAAGAACVTMVGTTTAVTRENVKRIIDEQGAYLKRKIKVSSIRK
ncbi:MAG: carbohydrate kinase family protein [Candidatus Bathyarchaeota archaeon]|nr:carbohydrate kinase family protein [Candidatus Bathyarchaeota archaeon]